MQVGTRSPPPGNGHHVGDRVEPGSRHAVLQWEHANHGQRRGDVLGCAINNAGVGYTLTATAASYTSATSSAFNVTAPAATISLTRSRGMITYGESLTFSVQFGTGGANRPFVLEYTSVGVPWTTIANLVTNSSGFASLAYAPARTGYVRARFAGTPDLGAATSTVYIVGVRQTISTLTRTTPTPGRSPGPVGRAPPSGCCAPTALARHVPDLPEGGRGQVPSTSAMRTPMFGVARLTFYWGTSVRGGWYVRAFAPRTPYNSISRYTLREVFLVR
jgi:hypothetical protein